MYPVTVLLTGYRTYPPTVPHASDDSSCQYEYDEEWNGEEEEVVEEVTEQERLKLLEAEEDSLLTCRRLFRHTPSGEDPPGTGGV